MLSILKDIINRKKRVSKKFSNPTLIQYKENKKLTSANEVPDEIPLDISYENSEDNTSKDEEEFEIVEREILPAKIICPDCGGITLEGLEFCDKCGGEL